ncbi:hypothetical protein H8959_022477 [Pygathrix nigripes]
MEPAGPAPGRLGPLLCLLLTASCAWSGSSFYHSTCFVPAQRVYPVVPAECSQCWPVLQMGNRSHPSGR